MSSKNKQSFMNRFIAFMEKYFEPVAARIEKQRHISSIKNGMIALISVLIIGSFSLIISAIGNMFPAGSVVKEFFVQNAAALNLPFQFTFGLLSIYAAITISYSHAKQMKVPVLHSVMAAVMVTLILNTKMVDGVLNTEFLDSRGLFIAIFAALISVELIGLFIRKNITIRIKGLPAGIATTFEAIIPLVVLLFSAVGLSILMQSVTSGQIIPEAFTTMLAPAINSIDTPYAILIGFVLPFMTQYLGANAAAYAAGEPIPHVFAPNFWDYFMGFSGSGITGALVILALFSKSRELKAVGKVSVVPAIFTISEPVVFGLPICFNPYLFIPFVLGTPILAVGQWFVFHFGWVRPPIANVGGTPIPLAQYLATMDWRAIILIIFVLAAAVCMYYPFFKMYEKSLIKEEEVVSERQAAHDALDLDF
ncbi:TPA_asm: PTS sugar transporter subunit IIC [Listeria monocytogenes]|uniref:PTS sugar transporter subunit IIC n=1 Tax=Listeria monocytogenes TaxID=1639 RepID=UPI0001B4271D|nr:PTS transporter subunit EIIC [Listeria monocytogenes]AGR26255.1 PTS beta-glucoside transporter subunit IIC [Listeria monocytogenes]EAA0215674.1 PTS sugar transporter subunit IIC [Listeria monocytogenes]EAC2790601.1 PTS sugar transporter subunit IIC [Listeria monocytogenes]EAC2838298.1 PTS sugar transporter subunit IIC [Listeria monocytogenes]EAD7191604.1 PTS sugar transporter subunit IIC [Listeria monocytogenes]